MRDGAEQKRVLSFVWRCHSDAAGRLVGSAHDGASHGRIRNRAKTQFKTFGNSSTTALCPPNNSVAAVIRMKHPSTLLPPPPPFHNHHPPTSPVTYSCPLPLSCDVSSPCVPPPLHLRQWTLGSVSARMQLQPITRCFSNPPTSLFKHCLTYPWICIFPINPAVVPATPSRAPCARRLFLPRTRCCQARCRQSPGRPLRICCRIGRRCAGGQARQEAVIIIPAAAFVVWL